MKKIRTDILVVGMGGAAQMAALNAFDANPDRNIVIVTKALQGKGGCSHMVQGGFNVVLNPADSHENHPRDTLKGGQYINNQELAKTLVEQATPTIYGHFAVHHGREQGPGGEHHESHRSLHRGGSVPGSACPDTGNRGEETTRVTVISYPGRRCNWLMP